MVVGVVAGSLVNGVFSLWGLTGLLFLLWGLTESMFSLWMLV